MPKSKSSYPPDRPIKLLLGVVAEDPTAWKTFVTTYSGFLYSLAWRYARGDVDTASELVLVALEGLGQANARGKKFYRLHNYLDSVERYGAQSKFQTWLALVVKNIFRDWFREKQGRKTLPKEIEKQGSLGQEIFRLIFWEGFEEREVFEILRSRGITLTEAEFDYLLERMYQKLTDRNLYSIYTELLKRLPAIKTGTDKTRPGRRAIVLPDLSPQSQPDFRTWYLEEQEEAENIFKWLTEALEALPEKTRVVFELAFFRQLPGDVIQKTMRFQKRQKVYDEIAKAKRGIKCYLERKGVLHYPVWDVLIALMEEKNLIKEVSDP